MAFHRASANKQNKIYRSLRSADHGIDSYKLLAEVDKQAAKAGKTVNCLLQLHIAREETKFGFSFDECREIWQPVNGESSSISGYAD